MLYFINKNHNFVKPKKKKLIRNVIYFNKKEKKRNGIKKWFKIKIKRFYAATYYLTANFENINFHK